VLRLAGGSPFHPAGFFVLVLISPHFAPPHPFPAGLHLAATYDTPPLAVLERARDELGIKEIIVWFSGGKDALATLDLCSQYFKRVVPVFMYTVPGLSFQEKMLQYAERRYGVSVIRMPHWNLPDILNAQVFRLPSAGLREAPLRTLKISHHERYLREKTGVEWIASGEKCCDSVQRNALIKVVNGIDPGRRRIWPIGYWSSRAVFSYLKSRSIPLPAEYRLSNIGRARSFGGRLWAEELMWVRDNFPQDFQRILDFFPLAKGQLVRFEAKQKQGAKE